MNIDYHLDIYLNVPKALPKENKINEVWKKIKSLYLIAVSMWSYLRDLVVRGPGLAARHVVVGVLQLIRELLHHQQYDRSVNKISQ